MAGGRGGPAGPKGRPDPAQQLCARVVGSVAWLGRAALSCLIFRQLLFEGMIPSSGCTPGAALHFPSRPLSGVSAPTVSPGLRQPQPPRLARSGSASCPCVAPLGKTPPASTPQAGGMCWESVTPCHRTVPRPQAAGRSVSECRPGGGTGNHAALGTEISYLWPWATARSPFVRGQHLAAAFPSLSTCSRLSAGFTRVRLFQAWLTGYSSNCKCKGKHETRTEGVVLEEGPVSCKGLRCFLVYGRFPQFRSQLQVSVLPPVQWARSSPPAATPGAFPLDRSSKCSASTEEACLCQAVIIWIAVICRNACPC